MSDIILYIMISCLFFYCLHLHNRLKLEAEIINLLDREQHEQNMAIIEMQKIVESYTKNFVNIHEILSTVLTDNVVSFLAEIDCIKTMNNTNAQAQKN